MNKKLKTLLIVVDMQNDFIDGALGGELAAAVVQPVCARIREASLDKDNVILFTQDTHFKVTYKNKAEGKQYLEHCIHNTDGWLIRPELTAAANTYRVVPKYEYCSISLLEEIEKIIWDDELNWQIEICGVATNICVLSTAIGCRMLYDRLPIIIHEEATAALTVADKEAAIKVLRANSIIVLEKDEDDE